jgi:hypothetical protein
MREYNFFSSFKMTLKNQFLSELRSVKNFIAKNFISNRLVIIFRFAAFLFFNRIVKNAQKIAFLQLSRKIKT